MDLRAQGEGALASLGRVPPWAIDALLATVFVGVAMLTTTDGADADAVYRDRDAPAVALILASTVPYYVRRRAPLAVLVVTAVPVAVLFLLDYNTGAQPFALLVGMYTVAAYRTPREVATAAAVIGVVLAVIFFGGAPGFGAGELLFSIAAFTMAALLGATTRSRRARIAASEHDQAEAARRAAADERLRIAQELHDVVAHSLGVIAVQAGVGMHVIDTDPAQAKRSLENISRASRSSLAEIRRLLGMVRDGEDGPAYTPAPGLADLPRLTRDVVAAGLPVELEVDVDVEAVPPGVGLAAYRIVQEALTNALRHANADHATVRLAHDTGTLSIEVLDDGRGTNGTAPPGGHGLVGMRERVAVYGGTLETGIRTGGGFRVAARLPFTEEPER